MPIFDISKLRVGAQLVSKAYLGSTLLGGGAPFILTTSPSALYSVRQYSGYSGPAIEVDGTTDVAFSSAKLPAVAAGAVSKLYDQSGNGLHALQATSALRPLVGSHGVIGGLQSITFDGANSGTFRTREMALPAGLALPNKDHTMIFVGRQCVSNAASAIASLSDGVSTDLIEYKVLQGLAAKGTSANQTMGIYTPVQPAAMAISSDASNSRFYQGNRLQNRTAFTGTATSAGGKIGNVATANRRGTFQLLALAFYTPALTPAQIDVALAELRAAHSIQNQFDTQVILDGDSNMEGTGSSLCLNTPVQLHSLLSKPVQMHNFANFGNTMQAIATLGTGRFTPGAGWTLDAPAKKIYVQAAGVNDCIGSRTSAQIVADAQTVVNAAVTRGYQAVICTVPPASSVKSTNETARQEYNTYLLANYATMGAAAVCDLAGDARLQTPTNTSYFDDGLHYNNGGRAVVAALLAAKINPLL